MIIPFKKSYDTLPYRQRAGLMRARIHTRMCELEELLLQGRTDLIGEARQVIHNWEIVCTMQGAK